jgi:ferredoxin
MKMHINRDACTGHGLCEGIRPDVFEVGDDGIVQLRTEKFTEADRRDLREAANQCPNQALTWED